MESQGIINNLRMVREISYPTGVPAPIWSTSLSTGRESWEHRIHGSMECPYIRKFVKKFLKIVISIFMLHWSPIAPLKSGLVASITGLDACKNYFMLKRNLRFLLINSLPA